jgi:EpsD family peptidyl-prolyl cis-trans isomerase
MLKACRPMIIQSSVKGLKFVGWVAVAMLSACRLGGQDSPTVTQAAAKVNQAELTVHQIRFALQQSRIPSDQASAEQQALEQLIDQELTLQKAAEFKLDRAPEVLQQIEAARREIISRAYVARIANSVAEPTSADIQAYYNDNPSLFKGRKVFKFQELLIACTPSQADELIKALEAAPGFAVFIERLKAQNLKYRSGQILRASEQLPMGRLSAIDQLKNGQSVAIPVPQGLQVLTLLEAQAQPVEEAMVRPMIAQFLLNDRKKKVVDGDLHALRSTAKIEYLGNYVKPAEGAGKLPGSVE